MMESIDQTRLIIATVDVVNADGRWRQVRQVHTRANHANTQKQRRDRWIGVETSNLRIKIGVYRPPSGSSSSGGGGGGDDRWS